MPDETNPEGGYQPSREEKKEARGHLTEEERKLSESREARIDEWEKMEKRMKALLEQFEEKAGPFQEMLESEDSLGRAEFLLTGGDYISVFYGEGIVPVTRSRYDYSPTEDGRNITNELGVQNNPTCGLFLREKMENYDQGGERIKVAEELIAIYETHINELVETSPTLKRYRDLAEKFFNNPEMEFAEEELDFLESLESLGIFYSRIDRVKNKNSLRCQFGKLFRKYAIFAEDPEKFVAYSSQMIDCLKRLKNTGRRPKT